MRQNWRLPAIFRPLAANQVMVAGVIDTLTNFVEHPEVVAERILRVARAVGDPLPGAGRHRLRLRHLGRPRPRGARRGLGEAPQPGRRRAPRLRPALPHGRLRRRACAGSAKCGANSPS